mmetsp:Transcript_106863/g.300446  ORF Transcript_106863/g.300446 Transcript_106863/m.300446 type:complete len:200 (+) Transcript_106863:50-649(+)
MVPWGPGRLACGTGTLAGEIVLDDSDIEIVRPGSSDGGGTSANGGLATEGGRAKAKATARFVEILGDAELSAAIVDAFYRAAGDQHKASHRLRSLVVALRSNAKLREGVLRAGTSGAVALALQDPREWASDGMKAKRQAWAQEELSKASQHGGYVRECPQCGGKAIFETGSHGDWKISKEFSHYRCTEVSCGQITHNSA